MPRKKKAVKLFNQERFRMLRQASGHAQQDIADKIGISRTAVSSYEQGLYEPTLGVLTKMATLLHTNVDYLLGRSEDMGPYWREINIVQITPNDYVGIPENG